MTLRIQFAHGLASNPQGAKARLFSQHFDACIPAMDTSDFEACVRMHEAELARFSPELLIGSSFGGAVVVALLERGSWRGPTLLLAQAAQYYAPASRLPEGVRVTLVHGTDDEVVPIEGSRVLARTGTPELVRLIEVDDNHALSGLVASGGLLEIVRRAAAAADPA